MEEELRRARLPDKRERYCHYFRIYGNNSEKATVLRTSGSKLTEESLHIDVSLLDWPQAFAIGRKVPLAELCPFLREREREREEKKISRTGDFPSTLYL